MSYEYLDEYLCERLLRIPFPITSAMMGSGRHWKNGAPLSCRHEIGVRKGLRKGVRKGLRKGVRNRCSYRCSKAKINKSINQ